MALPPRGPFAGRHLCWDVSPPTPQPQQSVDLTPPCCLQGAFPARLKKVFIVGAPMWFRVPYSIISLLLKEKLRERVSVGVSCPPPRRGTCRGGGLRLFSLWIRVVSAPCAPHPRLLEAAEPESLGSSLFRRGHPVLVFSTNIFEPLWKSPTISSSAVRPPAAAKRR